MNALKPQNINLLREMVIADFKLRYQGSILGYMWSLLRPLALFGILYVVFARFLRVGADIPHYPVYLLLGIVLWNFFLEATSLGLRAVVDRGELIRKVNIPKFIVVVAPVASAFVNLLLNFIVVLVFVGVSGIGVHKVLVFLPLILAELLVFSLSLSFLLSALYVRFRDIAYIWELAAQMLFYAVPIIYPLNSVPVKFAKYLLLNPVAQIIQDARYALITKQTITGSSLLSLPLRLVPFLIAAVLVVVSIRYFRSKSPYFAEDI